MADASPEWHERPTLKEAVLKERAAALGLLIAPERLGDVRAGARRLEENLRLLARFVAEWERSEG